jgi:saccharopine dehydrogenase-like NADP-dependent oxidoreductase
LSLKIAVLGGFGFQGRAALSDLARSPSVETVVCADVDLGARPSIARIAGAEKIVPVTLDAASIGAIRAILDQDVDAVIDLLPFPLMPNAFEAAIKSGVPLVSTNYGGVIRHLHEAAMTAGVALMPECGLDPGIDLIIYGHGLRQFDQLQVLNSYCGGFPEKKACTNPLSYKISWNWDMVLRAQKRPSVFIQNGQRREISAAEQHVNDMIHRIDFPGLGELEAVPNGDGVFYTDLLGVTQTMRETGRYALRWPGWCAFWAPLKQFGFLSDDPLPGLDGKITPHRFLDRLMAPQMQYQAGEKDLAAMVNVFEGIANGRRKRLTARLLIERDLETGLYAMSIGVGYTASIVAQMLASGQIARPGVLNPVVDVPYSAFMAELSKRGIDVTESVDFL